MKPVRTWIVIADGARARVVRNDGVGKGLAPALDFDFAVPHPHRAAFVSDRPGSYPDRGALGQHAFAPRTDRAVYERLLFARDVAAFLADAASRRLYDRLVLVAPPATLGRLRASLSPEARQRVSAELQKDLTHVPIHRLPRHLAVALAV